VNQEMIDGVWSDDPSIQLENASKFRYALSHADDPPVAKIVESGVVPRFVEFLKKEDNIEIQYAAACVLRMVSEGNTKVIIDHGVIQIFVRLLGRATSRVHLRFQATLALGNVARASVESRNIVLLRGAMGPVLAQLKENTEIWMLTTAARTLLHLCAGLPRPPFHQIGSHVLAALQRVLHKDDEYFLSNACTALYFLADGSKQNIQTFINADIVPRLVQLLGHVSPSVIEPVVSTILYLSNGIKQQTKVLIECGVLPLLANLLTTQGNDTRWKNIKRNACWTISMITAGTEEQIQAVIDANLIPTLVNLAQNPELEIKEKVVRAISNATSGGSHDQTKYLVEQGCIKPLCDLLVCPNVRIISACLNGLERILMAGEVEKNTTGDVNLYSQMIGDAEGKEKIENLQQHESREVNEKALKIVETYWKKEDDDQTQQPPR
ncbi:hypothetical protein CARUB_v10026424mg, partial [Capsella rubella]